MPEKAKANSKRPSAGDSVELDFGLGKLSLGGLLKGLGNLVDLARTLEENAGQIQKEGQLRAGKELKGVYGFSIRTLAGGKPVVESFGNVVKSTARGPVVEDVREPLVDLFDEKDRIRVIAEMPGAGEAEVKAEINGDILSISTTGARKYTKEILLPAKVREESLRSEYRNGLLEIELEKA